MMATWTWVLQLFFIKISVQNYINILLSTTRFECGLDIMTFYLKLCVRFCSRFDVTFPGFRHSDNATVAWASVVLIFSH